MARRKSDPDRLRGSPPAAKPSESLSPLPFLSPQARSASASAQQVARDHHPMHFRGAFADPADARLAVPSLERKLLAHAVTAMDLHRAINHAAERLTGVEFRD